MNTLNLTEAVAEKTGLSKTDAKKALVATIDTITVAVGKGRKVRLVGFGTFEQVKRKARFGFNPKTRQAIKIAASKLPKFRPGRAFKEFVNGTLKSGPTKLSKAKVRKTSNKKTATVTASPVKKAVTKTTSKRTKSSEATFSVLGRKSRTTTGKKTVAARGRPKTAKKFR